jgi:hypothetical protein
MRLARIAGVLNDWGLEGRFEMTLDKAGNVIGRPITEQFMPDRNDPAVRQARVAKDQDAMRYVWRVRSGEESYTNAEYRLPDTQCGLKRDHVRDVLRRLAKPSAQDIKVMAGENTVPLHGGWINLKQRLAHMAQAKPFIAPRGPIAPEAAQPAQPRTDAVPAQPSQPGRAAVPAKRAHPGKDAVPAKPGQPGQPGSKVWINLAMDGTTRFSKTYVHFTVGETFAPEADLASWTLAQGSEKWQTLKALTAFIRADEQLAEALRQRYPTAANVDERIQLFLLSDSKGHTTMSGCVPFTANEPDACVCCACGKNRKDVLAVFGEWNTIAHAVFALRCPGTCILGSIAPDQRLPDYGLHGVLRMLHCALEGMLRLMKRLGRTGTRSRHQIQEILNMSRLQARTRTVGELDSETGKKLRVEAGAAMHLMRKGEWKQLVDVLAGTEYHAAVQQWFEAFAVTCGMAWQSAFFKPAELVAMERALTEMGRLHRSIDFKVTLWAHLWIDHMHWYSQKWRILSVFSCFRMEASHRRLKAMLRHSGGTSSMRGKNGLTRIVDRHTVDQALRGHGFEVNVRAWSLQPTYIRHKAFWLGRLGGRTRPDGQPRIKGQHRL